MAVFLINICKFNGCGLTFPTLGDLIQHIEDTHLDYDPRILEKQELQQPPCLPLSYILRFYTDAARKENLELLKKKQRALSPAASIRSTTPTGSEFDDDEILTESEDSNDSWTTQEEFSSDFILRYGSRMIGPTNMSEEKPFACPVPGCKKRYKNVNGIKYHAKNGHRKDARIKKPFKCQCGKSYKTAKGLRNHAMTHHNPSVAVMSQTGDVFQVSPVTALTSLHQVVPPVSSIMGTNGSSLQGFSPNAITTSTLLTPSKSTKSSGVIVETIGDPSCGIPILNSTLPQTIGLPLTPTTPVSETNVSPVATPPPSASPVSPQSTRMSTIQTAAVNYNPLTPSSPNSTAVITTPVVTQISPPIVSSQSF